jgi:signal transduction histidine kinase
MTKLQRRVIQAGVLAVVALACFAEVFFIMVLPDRIIWQLSFPPVRPWADVLVDIAPGSAFAFAGLIAWSVRPRNRVGLLMMGVGVGLLVGVRPGPRASSALPDTLSHLVFPWSAIALQILGALGVVMLIHLLLAFPGGRLASRLDRALVRSFYVVVPLAAVLGAAATDVPPEVIGIFGAFDSKIFGYANALPNIIYLACLVLGSGLVIRRWLLGGRAKRRSLSPVFWSLLPVVLAFLPWTLLGFLGLFWQKPQIGPLTAPLWTSATLSPLLLVALPVGFLIGLLRAGLDMSSVGDLVVRLSDGLSPDQLQPALARALQDPSLEVVYWLPALGWFADLDGSRVELPGPDSDRAVSVLGEASTPVAALVYDSSLVHEGQLLDTAAAAVHMALENARLQVQLRAQLEEVRQSRVRLVEAADSERQRVERDLHDGAQQQLVTLLLSMQAAKSEALRQGDRRVADLIDANIASLKLALDELRELARGIHPTILTQAGLLPAIRSLAERSPIPVEVTGEMGEVRLAPPLEAALYFVVAEAITNAVKHSKGRRLGVIVGRRAGLATIEICDDGVGGADLSRGSGLLGLTDRVAAMGGRLVVKSDLGKGTTINAEVPCG